MKATGHLIEQFVSTFSHGFSLNIFISIFYIYYILYVCNCYIKLKWINFAHEINNTQKSKL
jgi:hypothetical protein